jgi:hypothetical protein
MANREDNDIQEKFSTKRNILNREDLEYSAQKIFIYATIGLTAIGIYTYLAFLVVQQAKK